jgi:hypothetical protein
MELSEREIRSGKARCVLEWSRVGKVYLCMYWSGDRIPRKRLRNVTHSPLLFLYDTHVRAGARIQEYRPG